MLLEKLYELSQRSDIKEILGISGYNRIKVDFWINIDPDGHLINITPGQKEKIILADIRKSNEIKPRLFTERPEYLFYDLGTDERSKSKYKAFKKITNLCYEQTQDPNVSAVLKFLENWENNPQPEILANLKIDGKLLSFQVLQTDGRYLPLGSPENTNIVNFWTEQLKDQDPKNKQTCLVTGKEAIAIERMPITIMGIPGGQPTGTSLVSANMPSFTAYGLEASLTSPMGEEGATGWGKALNYLIQTRGYNTRINNTIFICWTKNKTIPLANIITKKHSKYFPRVVKELVKKNPDLIKGNRFYGAILTANAARIVVRHWFDLELETAINNYLNTLSYRVNDKTQGYISLKTLAQSFYRDPSKENKSKSSTTELIKAVIENRELPIGIFNDVSRYNIKNGRSQGNTALINWYLKNNMNEDQTSNAYKTGQLLALLEKIQKKAVGYDINKGVVEKHFYALATYPGKTLGNLINQANRHLVTIKRTRPDTHTFLTKELSEMVNNIQYQENFNNQEKLEFNQGFYAQKREYYEQGQTYQKNLEAKATEPDKQ